MNKEDCAGFDTCRKYIKSKDLECEGCDNYMATECFEDYEGRDPKINHLLISRRIKESETDG